MDLLENKLISTAQTLEQYKFKIIDLESRSCRQNLRIIGLCEDVESGDLTKFFSQFLMDVFGSEAFSTTPILDHVHRALTAKHPKELKPRPVILQVHCV